MVRRWPIMLAISWAASSLTLTAAGSLAALPQAEEQAGEASKESSSVPKTKELSAEKKHRYGSGFGV